MEAGVMTFKSNDHNEMDLLNDSYINTSERTKKWLEKSWAEPFAQIIFPAINENRFEVLYDGDTGRPNTPINYILGALIIKELRSLTDEELKLRCHTDLSVQHALHSTSWKEQPVSDRTFSRFRERCYLYELETGTDLIQKEMEALSGKLSEYFDVNQTKKRMDSMMIASNTRNLSRLELLYTCVENVVRKIGKEYPAIDLSDYERYLETLHENEFIYHNDQPYNEKLQTILLDGYHLMNKFESTLKEDSDYQLLCRVLDEQSIVEKDGNPSLKKGKEISSTSLQTPVEPKSTYRFKSGQHHKGYVANIVETVDEDKSFITQYAFEPNVHSDVAFAYETIEKMGKQEQQTVLVGDGAFDSEDARELGKSHGIDLVNTELKGRSPNPAYAEIMIDEKDNTVEIPNGIVAQSVSYYEQTDTYRALFDKEDDTIDSCDVFEMMKEQKKTYVLMVTPKMIRRANQAKEMKSKEFLQYTYFRNGVEGIPSVLRRAYNVDCIPFRGLVRKKHCLGIKMMAINCKRAIKYQQNQEKVIS